MSTSRRDLRLGRGLILVALIACAGACAIPYPITVASGPFVVPPAPDRKPLGSGAGVMVVATAPANCRYLGLATGVGGIEETDPPASPLRDSMVRARALVSLRNAVGDVAGSHVTVDAEEAWTRGGANGFTDVVVRGGAFACR